MLNVKQCFIVVVFILHMVIGRPSDSLNSEDKPSYEFLENLKATIKKGIAENPGTPIMASNLLKENVCEAKPFNHTIRRENCKPKTIQNRFCYGQCNSFYIPGRKAMNTCLQCKPEYVFNDTVILECTKDNHLTFKEVKVETVISCKCKTCSWRIVSAVSPSRCFLHFNKEVEDVTTFVVLQ